jgi:hypothetical protein
MAVNDIAGAATYAGLTPQQLLAGDMPMKTDAGAAAADITKYQLCALLAAGTLTPFVTGTHTAAQAVLAMQAALTGQQCVYAHTGIFNDAIVTWPAGAALDTYVERRAFFTGTFKVSKLYPSV